MINAGKYNLKITIYQETIVKDLDGFPQKTLTAVLTTYASVKTTKGFTLIINGTDFEKALTNFTIRYPVTQITRDMIVMFKGKQYEIQYLNNIDEADVELEMQCKEVTH